jgi:CRP/FNR family transcriptional regulator, cyclic AMP receptor protein
MSSEASEILAEVPLFSLLDDSERAVLAERVEVKKFEKGKAIFNRGDPGDALFIVKAGEVEISVLTDSGDKLVLEHAKPGDFFGEVSLLDGGARTASAIAEDDTTTLVVDRGDLEEFLRLRPAATMDLLAAFGRRLRESATLLRRAVTRNVNVEEEDRRTTVMKVADWISDFSGSLPFLFIHCGLFFVWIILNVRPLSNHPPLGGFDPFPFGLLTMCVSLEAIILSVFVLLSQNRQVARDRVRNDVEYNANLRGELEVAHLHEKVDHMHEEIVKRLAALEKNSTAKA